jgi:hypothetical protein
VNRTSDFPSNVSLMNHLDAHLGGQRPFGLNYWPLPQDAPAVDIPRESIRLVTPDGALVRGSVVDATKRQMENCRDLVASPW